jgi:hypothetical protein
MQQLTYLQIRLYMLPVEYNQFSSLYLNEYELNNIEYHNNTPQLTVEELTTNIT